MHKIYLTFLPLFFFSILLCKGQSTQVYGTVQDSVGKPVSLVNILIEGSSKGTTSNDNGKYSLSLPADSTISLIFSHSEFLRRTIPVKLNRGESRELNITLSYNTVMLEGVEVTEVIDNTREEVGTIELNPKTLEAIPTPFGDFNQALISGGGLGITGNNELSASYAVRGGNFDENLVYVNGIQIYRPFLVRAGQQE
ncbi:MAG: colicin receptor, partial [Thalassobius sp.]|nr:colicin receptor [Thalassovita sp.]